MFEEHVIIMDLSLEENQGETLGSWGLQVPAKFQNVGEGCGLPTLKSCEGGIKDSGCGHWAMLGFRAKD